MPWRAARRPTTWKPIILDTATSAANGSATRLLASASSVSLIPIPWSSISSTYPLPVGPPETATLVVGEENEVAFSTSSASRWGTSLGAWRAGAGSGEVGDPGNLPPRVVLDLGPRGLDHVAQRHRLAPAAALVDARQHDQVLHIASQTGGDVVTPG